MNSRFELHQGDCMEMIKKIPGYSIDLILCDLPYGITANKWDTVLDLTLLWTEYERVLKPHGVVVLFASQPFTTSVISSNKTLFKYVWYWEKNRATGHLSAQKQPMRKIEDLCVFYKAPCLYQPQMSIGKPYSHSGGKNHNGTTYGARSIQKQSIENKGTRYPTNILNFDTVGQKGRNHPSEKPVDLLLYLIKTYTKEHDTILDNCMGSGSTGVAAASSSRKFIGIELNEEFFNIARQRIIKSFEDSMPPL